MGDARRRAEEALRMFDQTATPEPHEVYLYRAIAALREILAEEDERGAEPRECLCRCPETPGTHTATRCWDPAPPAPEITRHPCGCVDDGRPHGTLGHHNGHVICDSCGVCKDCDLPTPTEIRKDYLALHRFASALRWAVAQGAQGRRSDRLDLPPLLASVFDSIIAVLTRSQAASVAPAPPAADEVREAAEELQRIDNLLARRVTLDGLTRVQKIALALRVCEETDPKGAIAARYTAALAKLKEVK